MDSILYSVRMRASLDGKHCCGAERIVGRDAVEQVMQELTTRALQRGSAPDNIVVHVDSLANLDILTCKALDVTTVDCSDVMSSRSAAIAVLKCCGVSESAAGHAVECLRKGPAPAGAVMRGAVLMDARTGDRYEDDKERGVRASRFDWTSDALVEIRRILEHAGLTHFRTREALALATKIAGAPGVVAELCWSDDGDYTAGYVASRKTGYVRFPALKDRGDPKGGRVIFLIDRADLGACIEYLRSKPLLITQAGSCRGPMKDPEYLAELSHVLRNSE